MHNSHQSFAARQRLLNYDGDASNQLIWFTDAPPRAPGRSSTRHRRRSSCSTGGWRTSPANPERGVGGNKPADARTPASRERHAGRQRDDVWDGILDGDPKGACTQAFPPYSTSRIVAGGPIEGASSSATCSPSWTRSPAASTGRGSDRRGAHG